MQVQEKILRVVEYGTYERVGSSVTHEADVRIIGATNADLKQMCKEGKFKDLDAAFGNGIGRRVFATVRIICPALYIVCIA